MLQSAQGWLESELPTTLHLSDATWSAQWSSMWSIFIAECSCCGASRLLHHSA